MQRNKKREKKEGVREGRRAEEREGGRHAESLCLAAALQAAF